MNTMIWTVKAVFYGCNLTAVVVCGNKRELVDHARIIKTAEFDGEDYSDHDIKLLGFTGGVWQTPKLIVAESL